MRRSVHLQRPSGEQGFTLLEGMLAAVVLGVGLLAMSAMQGIALVRNVDANELTRITTIGSDMLERIQFNRRNAASYNAIDTQSVTNCTSISATTQPQARGDCLLWSSMVSGTQLENVRGTVAVSNVIDPVALGQRTVTVTLTWMGSLKSELSLKKSRSVTLNRTIAPE